MVLKMTECIERRTAISKLTALEVIEPSATMTDAKRVLADMPAAKAVSLHDIYRVIAGHSYYHGDRILAALSCIAEGKEVNPVRPADVAPVVHTRWAHLGGDEWCCPVCGFVITTEGSWDKPTKKYCEDCGAMMDGEPCTPSK